MRLLSERCVVGEVASPARRYEGHCDSLDVAQSTWFCAWRRLPSCQEIALSRGRSLSFCNPPAQHVMFYLTPSFFTLAFLRCTSLAPQVSLLVPLPRISQSRSNASLPLGVWPGYYPPDVLACRWPYLALGELRRLFHVSCQLPATSLRLVR